MAELLSCFNAIGRGCASVCGFRRQKWNKLEDQACDQMPAVPFTSVAPRVVSSSPAISRLQHVLNARDLAEACKFIAPGRIFRSACPTKANDADMKILTKELGVQQLIDLRSDYERQHDVKDAQPLLLQNAQLVGSGRSAWPALSRKTGPLGSGEATGQQIVLRHMSLLERNRYYKSLLVRLPLSKAASLVFWNILNHGYAKSLAIREINREGLAGLYETILETARAEIRQALEVITEAAESDQPTLFFCKVGKDRTGLLAALVLSCCGASDVEIISDYHRSDDVGAVALGGMEKDKELKELDIDTFMRAPPGAMAAVLAYLRERYGSVSGYMDSAGFDSHAQSRLMRSLAAAPRPAAL